MSTNKEPKNLTEKEQAVLIDTMHRISAWYVNNHTVENITVIMSSVAALHTLDTMSAHYDLPYDDWAFMRDVDERMFLITQRSKSLILTLARILEECDKYYREVVGHDTNYLGGVVKRVTEISKQREET
jgi:hypothetical protein